jgi:hypothetical protein
LLIDPLATLPAKLAQRENSCNYWKQQGKSFDTRNASEIDASLCHEPENEFALRHRNEKNDRRSETCVKPICGLSPQQIVSVR